MAPIGPIIPPGLAGVDTRNREAEKARERKRLPKGADAFQRALDEAEISAIPAVDAAEEVRSVKANDSEESHEDRTAHANYDPRGGSTAVPPPPGPPLDIKG